MGRIEGGKTYYEATCNEAVAPAPLPLDARTKADVVIVGAGFTGLSLAISLAERGMRVALFERATVGAGASGRNGGQVTGCFSGESAMRRQMARILGSELDAFIWQFRWRGHEIIAERVARYGIQCDLKHGHLLMAYRPQHMAGLRVEYDAAVHRGMATEIELLDREGVHGLIDSPRFYGGLLNRRNLHLHPLNLCRGEARAARTLGVKIYEGVAAEAIQMRRSVATTRSASDVGRSVSNVRITTSSGDIDCEHVVIAGDVLHNLLPGQLRGMVFPAYGGILATAPLGALAQRINPRDLAVYDTRFVLDYHRLTADGRLLFGGGAHYGGRTDFDVVRELLPAVHATYPALRHAPIDYAWRCAMGIVVNRIPQVGRIGSHIWYCQGYSGHGIAMSHAAAEIVAEAIWGQASRFDAFAQCRHWRIPAPGVMGGPLLTLGALYYRLRDTLR